MLGLSSWEATSLVRTAEQVNWRQGRAFAVGPILANLFSGAVVPDLAAMKFNVNSIQIGKVVMRSLRTIPIRTSVGFS